MKGKLTMNETCILLRSLKNDGIMREKQINIEFCFFLTKKKVFLEHILNELCFSQEPFLKKKLRTILSIQKFIEELCKYSWFQKEVIELIVYRELFAQLLNIKGFEFLGEYLQNDKSSFT